MANKSRPLQRVLYLFCEGDTEFHYFTGFKTSNRFSFMIKPVDVKGGGYAKMTAEGDTYWNGRFDCEGNSH